MEDGEGQVVSVKKTVFSMIVVFLNFAVLFSLAVILYFTYMNGFVIRLNINTIGEAGWEILALSLVIPVVVVGQILMLKWIDQGED